VVCKRFSRPIQQFFRPAGGWLFPFLQFLALFLDAARAKRYSKDVTATLLIAGALMLDESFDTFRLNRQVISVGPLENDDQREHWSRASADERLAALEFMRQVMYGYDPASTRLQRLLRVVPLGTD
jgi:hypothetical protein